MNEPKHVSDAEMAEMQRMKAYYPYRIVFGIRDAGGKLDVQCAHDMRRPNKAVREGKTVVVFKSGNAH
jgi:hypothetical protein